MDKNFEDFSQKITPHIINSSNKIFIPTKVLEEIKKFDSDPKDLVRNKKASDALVILKKMHNQNLIEIRGEKTDNFADNVFMTVFTQHRLNHSLMLITQDKNLTKDILSLNSFKSQRGKTIVVKKISKEGLLTDVFEPPTSKTVKLKIEEKEKFILSKELTKLQPMVLNTKYIPQEGDMLNGKIQLGKKIASGGEGSVYTTNSEEYVAKIYKKEKLTNLKYEKIKVMISKKIQYKGICWPVEILHNEFGEFVGYLMLKGTGKELQKCLFVKPLLEKNFPKWKKRNTVELCITILKKIKYLHERNIILGDINPMNILVVSSTEVYFVDTDSYQIEEYPCPVGTVNYTAPEIQRKNFSSFLRTFGNENFAVATLMFMIMLPGKPPYSQQGGGNPIQNILNMDFSYSVGVKRNGKVPEGA